MKICIIGLGRMGLSIAHRLLAAGHSVIGYDPSETSQKTAQELGVTIIKSLEAAAQQSSIFWLMLPAGEIIDTTLETLQSLVKPCSIFIDGGNSNFHDTMRRNEMLSKQNLHFIDCGTSGGLHGRDTGFSLMIGGDKNIFNKIEDIFKAVASPEGYAYLGPSGAGHYVKMVHNGIEYALLQSYAEGLNVLKNGAYKNLDLASVTKVWENGSIIRSWINALLQDILKKDQNLTEISGAIDENKTGRWTLDEAEKHNIPVDLIKKSLEIRTWSRETGGNYATKIVAMLRNAFGGHTLHKEEKK